jgi:CubicO group peptidase (beta-lactamase class C family)
VLKALTKLGARRFPLGDKFEYSKLELILLALIVERVAGQPYRLFFGNLSN